jgi:hypothetical protein
MMLKRSIIIALFLVSTSAFGQMRDYIVKTNGDTLRGELRFENKITSGILFRSSQESFTRYTPDEVTSFLNNGVQRFRSIRNPQTSQNQFSEILVDGPATLSKSGDVFFVLKEDKVYLLEKKDTTWNGMIKKDKKFIGVLSVILTGCESIRKKLPSRTFSSSSLIPLISSYNKCIAPSWSKKVYKRRRAGSIVVGVKGGYSTSKMMLPLEDSKFYNVEFEPVRAVPVGIWGSLPISRKFSFQVEFAHTKKGGTHTRIVNSGSFNQQTDTKFDFSYWEIPVTLRYTLFEKRFSPVLFAGVMYGNSASYDAYQEVHLYAGGTQKTDIVVNPTEYGFRGGVALNWRFSDRILVGGEYYYEYLMANPYAANNVIESSTHVISFSVGYVLTGKQDK